MGSVGAEKTTSEESGDWLAHNRRRDKANVSPQTTTRLNVPAKRSRFLLLTAKETGALSKQYPFQVFRTQRPTLRERSLRWQRARKAHEELCTGFKGYGHPHYLGLPPRVRNLIQVYVLFEGRRHDTVSIDEAFWPPEFQLSRTCKQIYSEVWWYREASTSFFWSHVRLLFQPGSRIDALDRIAATDLQSVKNIEFVMSIDQAEACFRADLSRLRPTRPKPIIHFVRVDRGIWRDSFCALHYDTDVKEYLELRAVAGFNVVGSSWQRYPNWEVDMQTEVYKEPFKLAVTRQELKLLAGVGNGTRCVSPEHSYFDHSIWL